MKDKIRVFIIEDEWMWSEAIISVLKKRSDILLLGEAKSAEAGLLKIKELRPDIILMDIRLQGGLSGIQATAEVVRTTKHTKVIVFTIDPDEEHLYAAIKAGAAGYLLKKEVNDPEILIKAISEVHRGQAFITPAVTRKVLNIIREIKNPDNRYNLSNREKEILRHMSEGKPNKEIAYALGIHERTVANHISNIFRKLEVGNRVEAVKKARDQKLL
ncbi:MAG: response regulator transcription factor [Spirochaetales bacterium]|nr:response regulator transcription factor [Spirochaetales bacterium]